MDDVVQQAVGTAGRSIVAFAAEHVDKPRGVWRPVSHTSAPSHRVVHVAELEEVVTSWLIDVYRALPPNPLADAELIFPNVVQEAGRLVPLEPYPKPPKRNRLPSGLTQPADPQREPGTFVAAALVVALEMACGGIRMVKI